MDEHTFLQRTFKFFDIQNRGCVTLDQFRRTLTKIGVVVPNEADVETIFHFYDKSGDGSIDYKEFIRAFKASNDAEFDQQPRQPTNYNKPKTNLKQEELEVMLGLFRDKIKSRGPRGIIGLQRIFEKMDDDDSGMLSVGEFEKACRDFRIGITPEFMPVVFDAFDINHDGSLSTAEFMRGICGELPHSRLQSITEAFRNVCQGKGLLTMAELRERFQAARHPEVVNSNRTEDQVLIEFLETFEIHHNIYKHKRQDGNIGQDEFTDYYRTVSWCDDSDDHFNLTIKCVWGLRNDSDPYQKF